MDRIGSPRRWLLLLGISAAIATSGHLGRVSGQGAAPTTAPSAEPTTAGPAPARDSESSRGADPTDLAARPAVDRGSILQLIRRANPMLWLLVACSIVTMGFAMERLVALRRERVVPSEFVDRFLERLSSGKLDRDRAIELCKAHDSPVARVFGFVVKAWGQPGLAIRQIVDHDAAGEIVELKRNVRILNAMATIGPLLGLLGTVVGIIQSFDALGGRVGPAKGEALAHGISLALVATAFGLVIALFSVAMYYHLLNRVDRLARDLDDAARHVIDLVCAEAIRQAPAVDRPQH